MTNAKTPSHTASTRVSRIVHAPRHAVFQAFLDADAVAVWLAPDTMTGTVHVFEPRRGGQIRMSLTYQNIGETPDGRGGKSSADTDTFQGTIVEIVPDEQIVWVTQFESPDPAFAGEMTLVWSFADAPGGTEVTVLCENIPAGIRPQDNEAGSRSTLEKLAAFVE